MIIEPLPLHLDTTDYGYLEALVYSWLLGSFESYDLPLLVLIMMMNIKAGFLYGFPWCPDHLKEFVALIKQMKDAGADEHTLKPLMKQLIEIFPLGGFMTDFIQVGNSKRSCMWFKPVNDVYDTLFNMFTVSINNKNYDFDIPNLLWKYIFEDFAEQSLINNGLVRDGFVRCIAYMHTNPYSHAARKTSRADFIQWCKDKFEGFDPIDPKYGVPTKDAIRNWWRRYAMFNEPKHVLLLAYEMLAHIRWLFFENTNGQWGGALHFYSNDTTITKTIGEDPDGSKAWAEVETTLKTRLSTGTMWEHNPAVLPNTLHPERYAAFGYNNKLNMSTAYATAGTTLSWPWTGSVYPDSETTGGKTGRVAGGFTRRPFDRAISGNIALDMWSCMNCLSSLPSSDPAYLPFGWEEMPETVGMVIGWHTPSFYDRNPETTFPSGETPLLDELNAEFGLDLALGSSFLVPPVSGTFNPLSSVNLYKLEGRYIAFQTPEDREPQMEVYQLNPSYYGFDMNRVFPTFEKLLEDKVIADYITPVSANVEPNEDDYGLQPEDEDDEEEDE